MTLRGPQSCDGNAVAGDDGYRKFIDSIREETDLVWKPMCSGGNAVAEMWEGTGHPGKGSAREISSRSRKCRKRSLDTTRGRSRRGPVTGTRLWGHWGWIKGEGGADTNILHLMVGGGECHHGQRFLSIRECTMASDSGASESVTSEHLVPSIGLCHLQEAEEASGTPRPMGPPCPTAAREGERESESERHRQIQRQRNRCRSGPRRFTDAG